MKQPRLPGWSPWKIDAAGVTAIGLIAAMVVLLQVLPAIQHREAHQRLLAQLDQDKVKLAERRRAAAAIRGQLDQVETFLRDNHLELGGNDELNRRLARVSELTTAHGLQLDVIEPGKPVLGPQYDALPIKLSGQGGYRDVTRFLSDLRQALPDTAVTGFDLVGAADGAAGPGRFSFQLLWFSAPAGTQANVP